MGRVVELLVKALEATEGLQFAPIGFPKDVRTGVFLGTLRDLALAALCLLEGGAEACLFYVSEHGVFAGKAFAKRRRRLSCKAHGLPSYLFDVQIPFLRGEWQSLYATLLMRFEKCKQLGRLFYEVGGGLRPVAVGTGPSSDVRTVATALCLSKRLLQARAEAALLLSLMVTMPDAAFGNFQLTPEMLRNGTGLPLVRLGRFEDLKLEWLVLGVAKCGTTSLQYNLGIHPDAILKSTHQTTFSHTLLYSSSRFLPVHQLQREFLSGPPSTLTGHPDVIKANISNQWAQPTREKMVGCSLVADLAPAYEDGSGDMLSSLADPDATTERFLYPFLLSTLLKSKPLKMLYVVRDP
jgi:hypothetical protein